MTKSRHLVLSYDKLLGKNMRLKLETYMQFLRDVPVESHPSWYSVLNEGADFGTGNADSLVNEGTGKNTGVEITIEKFYSNGYYFLLTGSFFNSTYKGSDHVKRNTAFNGNYIGNFLFGKEWTFRRHNVIAFNLKTTYAGGKRYIPLDLAASQASGTTEFDYGHAFEKRRRDYFRTDLKMSYRINRKKSTHEIALDVDNVFNTQNIWQEQYDAKTNSVKTIYQLGLFPVPSYRVTF